MNQLPVESTYAAILNNWLRIRMVLLENVRVMRHIIVKWLDWRPENFYLIGTSLLCRYAIYGSTFYRLYFGVWHSIMMAWLTANVSAAWVVGIALGVGAIFLASSFFYYSTIKKMQRRIREAQAASAQAHALAQRAECATASKGEFLANMSHEIRTPLNNMIGTTELLLETELSPHQKFQLNTVMDSAETLLRIIDDILDFSKIESGTLTLDVAPFNPARLVEDTALMFVQRVREKARHHKIEMIVAPDISLPETVLGDALRVRQILTNLLSNAVKFTSEGEVAISAEPCLLDGCDQGIRFCVRDTGIGIPSKKRTCIFEKFIQADDLITTRHFGGTGLGLAICRQLVAIMGGTLTFESREGEGSAFTAELRLASTAAPQCRLPAHQFKNRRALIVDDAGSAALLLQGMLLQVGIRSFVSEDIQGAIATLNSAYETKMPIDYLFVEHRLPDGNAGMLMQQLASCELVGTPRLIGMSLLDDVHLARSFQQAGGHGFLRKPVLRSHLLHLLQRLEHPAGEFVDTRMLHADTTPNGAAAYPDYRHYSVLLVEDNRVNRELTLQMLAKFQIAAETAENGRDALAVLSTKPFDLVLMDCQMPVMDGFECTKLIRERIQSGEVQPMPIIALTANAMRGDRERCLEVGMDDYLSKPLRLQDIRSMLKRWFESDGASTSAMEWAA